MDVKKLIEIIKYNKPVYDNVDKIYDEIDEKFDELSPESLCEIYTDIIEKLLGIIEPIYHEFDKLKN